MHNIFTKINIQGIVICNSHRLEITQMPTNSRMDKQIMIYLFSRMSHSSKNEYSLTMCKHMDEFHKHNVGGIKVYQNKHIPHDVTSTKYKICC